jgi:hypothetical protein
MKRITTTIKREWLSKIIRGVKKIEYREVKPYWSKRLEGIECPFELRIINGMSKTAPEAILRIDKVTVGGETPTSLEYELHIGAVLKTKHCKKLDIASMTDIAEAIRSFAKKNPRRS